MGRTVDHGEDFVVDMVIEVGSRGTDVDALARRLMLPGMAVLRTTRGGLIWLSALVTAVGEPDAIRQVQDGALAALGGTAQVLAATVITDSPLGDLPSRLHAVLWDLEPGRLDAVLCDLEPRRPDLIDLVEVSTWDGPESRTGHHDRTAALRTTG